MLCPKCLPTFTEDSGSCLVPPIVDAYLKTNNAPLDLEIVDIRDSLQNLQQSLIQVDEEIKLLSQTLEKLKTRRVDISKAISKHSGVLSPVRRLPPEMLGEIFIRANDGCYAVFGTSYGPWALSHVNHQWRAAALAGPGCLWANPYITIDTDSCYKTDPTSLVRTALDRSRTQSLSLHFYYREPSSLPRVEERALEIFRLVMSHCERWHSLHLNNVSVAIHKLLDGVRGRLPRLLRLSMRGPAELEPLTAFAIAPQLRTVQIWEGSGVILGSGNPQLVSYTNYSDTSPPDSIPCYLEILHSCPLLREFSCFYSRNHRRSRAIRSPIQAPLLRSFRGCHPDLMKSLVVANLEKMGVEAKTGISFPRNSLLGVRDMFAWSQCRSLSKLRFTDAMIDNHILEILPLVPAMATLKFHFYSWVDKEDEERVFSEMFRRMMETWDNGTHKIVPALQEFSFTICPYNDDEAKWDSVRCIDSAFVEMLVSCAGATLSKVKVESSIFIPRHFSRGDIRILKSLGSRGLKVSINGFDIFPLLY